MDDFDYSDLRFHFETGIPWSEIQKARAETEDRSAEYVATLDHLARFVREKVAPRASLADEQGCRFDRTDAGPNRVRLPPAIEESLRDLKELGAFCGMTFPEPWGGLGLPLTVFFGVGELLSMGDSSLGLTPMLQEGVGHVLLEFAAEKLARELLPDLLSGERLCAMALTEPDAGSDLGRIQTRARPALAASDGLATRIRALQGLGAVYVLSGRKIFITNGFGDCLVLARTEEGFSLFWVAARDKTVTRIENKLGIRGSATCEVVFEDSPGLLVGEPGRGLVPCMLKLMLFARVAVACQALGIAQRAHSLAKRYATEVRFQFGVPLVEHGPVRRLLFENEIQLQAARALVYWAAACFDLQESGRLASGPFPALSSLAGADGAGRRARWARLTELLVPLVKYDAAELANRVVYESLQVFGGYGFTKEFPLERLYRDARITSLYEGTSQIQVREVANGAYWMEKLALNDQLKTGGGARFVETDRNRPFVDQVVEEEMRAIRAAPRGEPQALRGLLEGMGRLIDLFRDARRELFLRERAQSRHAAKAALSVLQEEYAELLALLLKGVALARSCARDPRRVAGTEAFLSWALPRAESLAAALRAGGKDLWSEDACAVLGLSLSERKQAAVGEA